jgi:GT2 family glycosyltransferase
MNGEAVATNGEWREAMSGLVHDMVHNVNPLGLKLPAQISIVTPWLNHSELCRTYAPSVAAAHQVIIVDNGSEPHHAAQIRAMVDELGGIYIRNEHNAGFAAANNQGLAVATGEIVVFLNNDTEAPNTWLQAVERDTTAGVIAGPSMQTRHGVNYIEGYCVAARRDVWLDLGGWPEDLPGMYWEDNILCLKAIRKGYRLVETNWPVWHFSNYTSRQTPGAYAHSAANERAFLEMLRNG